MAQKQTKNQSKPTPKKTHWSLSSEGMADDFWEVKRNLICRAAEKMGYRDSGWMKNLNNIQNSLRKETWGALPAFISVLEEIPTSLSLLQVQKCLRSNTLPNYHYAYHVPEKCMYTIWWIKINLLLVSIWKSLQVSPDCGSAEDEFSSHPNSPNDSGVSHSVIRHELEPLRIISDTELRYSHLQLWYMFYAYEGSTLVLQKQT